MDVNYVVQTITNRIRSLKRRPAVSSYDQAIIADAVTAKVQTLVKSLRQKRMLDFSPSPSSMGFLVSRTKEDELIVDFGGGAGQHYFIAQTLGVPLPSAWVVVETASMVRANRIYEDEILRFVTSLNDVKKRWPEKRVSLVMASGSLEYSPSPTQTLQEILTIQAEWVYFTRTLFADKREKSFERRSLLADNGPGSLPEGFPNVLVSYPMSALAKKDFESMVSQDYEIICSAKETKNVFKAGPEKLSEYMYLLRLRTLQ